MSRFTTDHPISKPIQRSIRARRAHRCFLIILGVLAIYVGSFVWQFEILGAPARNNERGWLGPAIRGDALFVDIGSVYYYEGTELSLYGWYRPLCGLWLAIQGLSD
jgi:hypothetical protein